MFEPYSDSILRRRPVLYVDDEAANRIVFQVTFRAKFDVICAADADEALEILAARSVAVMVTDERMPGTTGVELCELVRERFPQVRRIMVTAWSDEQTAVAAINRGGVSAYLAKPWVPEEVETLLRESLLAAELDRTAGDLVNALAERERLLAFDSLRGGVLHDIGGRIGALTLACDEIDMVTADLKPRLLTAEFEQFQAPLAVARQALDYIEGVLDSLRRDRVSAHGSPSRFHLRAALGSVERLVGLDGAIPVRVTCPDDVVCHTDRIGLCRILVNLVTNARFAMSDAGQTRGLVRIVAGTEGDAIHIDVADNGPGVPADARDKVFEAAWTTRGHAGGQGLGLSISRELARRAGGDLVLLDEPDGGGATFRLSVHASQSHPQTPAGATKRPQASRRDASESRR